MDKLTAFIDTSNYAESVCDHAAWIASQLGLSVELVHVLERKQGNHAHADLSGSIGLGARTALLEELADLDAQNAKLAQKRGRLLLEGALERLAAEGVTDVKTRLRNGDFVEAIEDVSADSVSSSSVSVAKGRTSPPVISAPIWNVPSDRQSSRCS
nr:universal stress protein [Marinicella sp. W31]MDC2875644.1 universal stress protein [Marinicella sp. W31]